MNKEEYRTQMAEMFINCLEEKGLDWVKEWQSAARYGRPRNGATNSVYRGVNALMLSMVALRRGYQDNRWVTMVQIIDKEEKYHKGQKWHLQKGSKASYVEYWYPYDLKDKKAVTWQKHGELLKSGRKEEEFILRTRYTPVFNATCVDGMTELPEPSKNEDVRADEIIGLIADGLGVSVLNDGGDRAFYRPTTDDIHLPEITSFNSSYGYAATALHELAHATGAKNRLRRDMEGFFGSSAYAFEELVAEITSCFMGVHLALEPDARHLENHKAYIQSWIKEIKDKPDSLAKAIRLAEDAANLLETAGGLAEVVSETEDVSEVA